MNKITGITTSSPVSMSIIVLAIGGAFGIFSYLSPKFSMIDTTAVELHGTVQRVDKVESAQLKYQDMFLKISISLSEIQGHLKGLEERRKKDD